MPDLFARPRLRPLLLALLCGGLALGAASRADADCDCFPKLALYGNIRGNGYPFYNLSGKLQDTTLTMVSRYHEVVLDASPISEYRSDVLVALRQRNPNITLLAFITGSVIWNAQDPDSLVHFPTRYRRLVRDLDGFLYNKSGREYRGDYANINLAKKDGTGRYVVVEAMADLFTDVIITPGMWDGMFIDLFCEDIGWTQTQFDSIDYVRAGYPTLAAFNAGWRAATDTLSTRLRQRGGPNFLLVGNCGLGTKYTLFNGWMREQFPQQTGGTWYTNMFSDPGGYFVDEARFLPERHNYNFTNVYGLFPYDVTNRKRVRLGLGSTALGEGLGPFGVASRDVAVAPYHTWWYDEYAVDLSNRRSSTLAQHTGWLGAAAGPAYQMIWIPAGPDGVANPGFENDVTTDWSLAAYAPATATRVRDTSQHPVGNASAKITIGTAASTDWFVTFSTVGTLPVSINQNYSATFWAKASTPRSISVAAGNPAGGGFGYRKISIDTSWKRYQVVLTMAASGNARLQFFLGLDAGDVWLDDVHFTQGESNMWRRDFQNGIVVVNPANVTLTAPLERSYLKIIGTVDPAVNNGQRVTQAAVASQDALFLLRDYSYLGVEDEAAGRLSLAVRPNPVRSGGAARVSLALPRAALVTLELLDVAGRVVERRTPERLGPGRAEIAWQPRRTPPGLYLVRARTDAGESRTTRWVVLR